MPRKEGQFLVEDFFTNVGGLNTSDSPFIVDASEATGGQNFDYQKQGAVQKRAGHTKLHLVPDANLRALGVNLWNKPGTPRVLVRGAGQKLQKFDFNAFTYTSLSEDTLAAGTNFLSSGSTQPVAASMFNTPTTGALWVAGGGLTNLYGVYSGIKVTANGVATPGGSVTTSVSAHNSGVFTAIGKYYYAVALSKASTGAIGNASLDVSATVVNLDDTVTVTLSSITGVDTTKYTKLYLYRSSVSGSLAFTAGAIAQIIDISGGIPTSVVDTGASVSSSENVPRANNTILDNSQLPTGAVSVVATFKRRLVTAQGSTVYFSDINKPESWPTYQSLCIPTGGDITGLAVVGYNSIFGTQIDELLCVFTQSEVWVITGDGTIVGGLPNWSLRFLDFCGAPNQQVIVSAHGYLAWINARGGFVWNGSGKPSYITPKIEDKFQAGGDIDKSKLNIAWGVFVQKRNEIQWYLSSKLYGEQRYVLKLDLKLTLQEASQNAVGATIIKGKFTPDVLAFPAYAGCSVLTSATSTEEVLYLGDGSGFTYSGYTNTADGGSDITFEYLTANLNYGTPSAAKRIHKVVAWVYDTGTYNLELDFWSNFRFSDADSTSISLPVSDNTTSLGFVWDVSKWDQAKWDGSSRKPKAITYNLPSTNGNSEGDSFRLRFRQSGGAQSVLIFGFSVYYTEVALRK